MNPSDKYEYSALAGVHSENDSSENKSKIGLMRIAQRVFKSEFELERLRKLIGDAKGSYISDEEISAVFSKPLPKADKDAEKELLERVRALRERIKSSKNYGTTSITALKVALIKTDTHALKLFQLRQVIQEFKDKDLTDLGVSASMLESMLFKISQWVDSVRNPFEQIQDSAWYEDLLNDLEVRFDRSRWEKVENFISSYNQHKIEVEHLVNKQLPYLLTVKKKLWHIKRALRIFNDITPKAPSNVSAVENFFVPTEKQSADPMFMECLSKLGFRKTCDVEDLARLLGKEDKANITKIKAVKRTFKGLPPIGKPGVDYKLTTSTEAHVKDGVAVRVGKPLINYIQGRTRFDTESAINLYMIVLIVKQVAQQLRKELGHKPTLEEVASEMGLHPDKLRYVYG